MSRRTERVNDLLREQLSELIQREVKDPRVARGLVSITEVQVSPDLRHATVYVSHLGDSGEREEALRGLNAAAHFLHTELMHRLKMRSVPELLFRFDPSIERGARLASLISDVAGPGPGS
ncbi:MAG: 30S ribosome-binding factor RbfA [Chloroflexi bacterium CFX7]|nr:MAG: 30S ribosome-binding factor RbfA [bacterium]MCE7927459.1 30S ribosome-binding factor RbfA [Chloroflexi bacterium CFX7]MCL4230825.1 30S ribosome-binding factor RbfA [Dehalococcoidia bacterium]RIL04123.1 MAG: 30S ribosome-binding factor RbfA [bacterium]